MIQSIFQNRKAMLFLKNSGRATEQDSCFGKKTKKVFTTFYSEMNSS